MSKIVQYDLNVDQVSKLNGMLPKGYKVISVEQNLKRLAQIKKKPKVIYAPIADVVADQEFNRRRNKTNVSYYEGEDNHRYKPNQDFQPQKNKTKKQFPKEMPVLKHKHSIEMQLPPLILPTNPLSPKQILEQLKGHPKFYVIQKFKTDYPSKCTYNALVGKVQQYGYTIHDLMSNMRNLFIDLYGYYSKNSEIYNDSAELQGFLSSLINSEKGKIKELKKEVKQIKQKEVSIKQESFTIPSLNKQQSQLLKKKTIPPKPDIKNITIMDKRILGQNMKKLPNECLPEICKIVFETLETRQQYEFDIDTLPLKKVKELQFYVNNCLARYGQNEDGNDIRNELDSTESNFIIEDDFSS